MGSWEHARDDTTTTGTLANFSFEELRRLFALRTRVCSSETIDDIGLDPRRLEFARWLVQQGRMTEGI